MFVWVSRLRRSLSCLVLLFALSASTGPADSQSPFTKSRLRDGVLMGAYDPYGTFANDAKINIEHIFVPWQDVNLASLNAADKYAQDRARNLLITVEPWTWSRDAKHESPDQLYTGIVAGSYDHLIGALCQKAASLTSEVTIRWAHEMDLGNNRYPWSSWMPVQYVTAYRHFVDTCRMAGRGLRFMWSPRGEPNLQEYYPGSAYVDSIGLTLFGFQKYEVELYGKALSLAERLAPSHELVVEYGKDIYISEFGCHGDNKYLKRCLEEARTASVGFPGIKGVIYFNEVETFPWPGRHAIPDWRIMSKLFAELPR
jgi:beta-mannanase